MDYKEIYNIIQDISYDDKIKNSLENLYLYLCEIENMIQNNNDYTPKNDNHDEFRYKLQVIEQQIAEIDELLLR